MLDRDWRWVLDEYDVGGDLAAVTALARKLERSGENEAAASAWDRAVGLAPEEVSIAERRQSVLDGLSLSWQGLAFRYIPAGSFWMGADDGDSDEAPRHPVRLDAYWMAEAPLSWSDFNRLAGWEGWSPPDDAGFSGRAQFFLSQDNKIRFQYCENRTQLAYDWHSHLQEEEGQDQLFPAPPRDETIAAGFELKPMVSVGWQQLAELADSLCDEEWTLALPTEAEWERAARGGLISAQFPWGNAPPDLDLADFGHLHEAVLRPSRATRPNGYGLYGMAGGVWEWCSDWYRDDAYAQAERFAPRGPKQGLSKVLRGGSWTDCPEALRCAFRSTRLSTSWREEGWSEHRSPNIGGRFVLRKKGSSISVAGR